MTWSIEPFKTPSGIDMDMCVSLDAKFNQIELPTKQVVVIVVRDRQ